DEKNANELAELVSIGTKRGTTSLYRLYELDNEEIPKEGSYSIVTDWYGVAKCIIENKKIHILPFKNVDDRLAYIEGEGDKSLAYWRKAHIDYFKNELTELNIEFNEDMIVVFEEFEVIYK
ncbi:MAG: ASCH domain-containing protein, partial [Paraclostridium sp.]